MAGGTRPLDRLHLDLPFAEGATERARRRIRADLATIAAAVARTDPHAQALVLTGGFSRGEGTLRGDAPVNDYDLICVRSRPGGGALHRAISDELSPKLGLHVDLMPIWRPRLRVVGRKLFWLDLQLGGHVIAGDPDALRTLRRLRVDELPRVEAARLLGNRAAGLLLSLPAEGEPADPHERDLQATKAVLAAMDATLIAEGRYAARMRDRLALTTDHPDHPLFATAVAWKLSGRAALPADYWDQAASCLLRAVDATGARGVADGLTEHAFYALRARRLAWAPSRRVREEAWRLLANARWGLIEPRWTSAKPRFFAQRAQTLQ